MLASLLLATCPVTARAQAVYLPLVGTRFLPHSLVWVTATKVVDGDTIWPDLDADTVGDVTVRYLGIDTAETYECYGPEATLFNHKLVGGQRVALQREVSDVDRYDRLLRHVYLKWGYPARTAYLWVNGHLVRMGYARVAIYAPDDRYEVALEALQEEARGRNAGGWGMCGW